MVLRGRNGGRIGRNLFLNLNLFLRGPKGPLVGFSSGSTWLAFVPKPPSLRSPSDDRSVSLTSSISLSSNSSPSLSCGNTVSVSTGRTVVDRRLAKILFLIEFFTGNRLLTLGVERMEETVVERAKPGLLGSRPGRLANNGLRVDGDGPAGASVANSDVVSSAPLLNSIIVVVCLGFADMPAASGLPVVASPVASVTGPGVVRSGGSRGLIVGTPRLIPGLLFLLSCTGVVAAVVAAVVLGRNENGRERLLPCSRPLFPRPRPPKRFPIVGRGGENPRTGGFVDTSLGRKVIPPVLGENVSATSSLSSSSWSLFVTAVVNLGTTVNRRGLGVDVSKNLWISSSSALSGLGVGVFLPPSPGFLETDDDVVLLGPSSPVGLLELGGGEVLPSRIAKFFFETDTGVVLAKTSSLFGRLEAGWNKLGLSLLGVVAAVLVLGWIEFLVRSLRSCRVSGGFLVVVASAVVVDVTAVVVAASSAGVRVVVFLVVTFVVPCEVSALTPSMLPRGISMILSTWNPSIVTVGRAAARLVAMPSFSSLPSGSPSSSLAPSDTS